jgi:hypothetical protein
MQESMIELAGYLGVDVNDLLRSPPFSGWDVIKSIERDLPEAEIHYEFSGHGVEVLCGEDDRIQTIFLHRGDGEALSGVPFSTSRREVLERYGTPSASGGAGNIPALGEHGAWDRFALSLGVIHFQYRPDCDEIELITLMCPDVATGPAGIQSQRDRRDPGLFP